MNSFSSGSRSRKPGANPGAELVLQATEKYLITSDWGINMEVSDYVNRSGELAAREVATALRKRLKKKNPKILLLSLTLLETLVKNCSFTLHAAVASEKFQSAVYSVAVCKFPEASERALKLIQQFGIAFESMQETLPGYMSTWNKLKQQQVIFPPIDEAEPPVFTPPPVAGSNESALSTGMTKPISVTETRTAQFKKLEKDLGEVLEQTKSARKLMDSHTGGKLSDAILDVLDFLDQCKPRLVHIIEAGANGLLDDFEGHGMMLENAFKAHDETCACLDRGKSLESSKESSQPLIEVDDPAPAASAESMATSANGSIMAQYNAPGGTTNTIKPRGSGLDDLDLDSLIPPSPSPTNPFNSTQETQVAREQSLVDEFDTFAASSGSVTGGGATSASGLDDLNLDFLSTS